MNRFAIYRKSCTKIRAALRIALVLFTIIFASSGMLSCYLLGNDIITVQMIQGEEENESGGNQVKESSKTDGYPNELLIYSGIDEEVQIILVISDNLRQTPYAEIITPPPERC